jgi:hypothetical protein
MRAGEALRFKRDLSHDIRTHYGDYWYVRGHARRIRDKKTGEIRVVWVKPYIKGPDGKPIRVTEKVYALKR